LTPDDIFDLSERGKEVLRPLAERIMSLSWMTKDAMFRFNPKTDDRQSAAGEGDSPNDGGDAT
jgi:hypothetical protein